MRVTSSGKVKGTKPVVYSVENDPMARLLVANGFREMSDSEYSKVKPYLTPKKAK